MTFAKFVGEAESELRRVSWPKRVVCLNHTIVVLATLIVLTILIGGFDYVFGESVNWLLR